MSTVSISILAIVVTFLLVQLSLASPVPSVEAKAQQETGSELKPLAGGERQAEARTSKLAALRASSADKLKLGLSNFMNQLNPAPYFVPVSPVQHQSHGLPSGDTKVAAKLASSGPQSAAEPATLVNGEPMADVLIKGSHRLGQTRPIGGPLRWG